VKLELFNEFGEFVDPNDYGSGAPINVRAKYSCPEMGAQLWDTDFTLYPGNQGNDYTDLYKCRNGSIPALAFFKVSQRRTEFDILRQYTVSKTHYRLYIRMETPIPPPMPYSREFYRTMFTIDADISILPTVDYPGKVTAEDPLWKGNEKQFYIDWTNSFDQSRMNYRDEQEWNEELAYYNEYKSRHPNECYVVYGWTGEGITLSGDTSLWWCMYWDPYGILTVEYCVGGTFDHRPLPCSQYDYLKNKNKYPPRDSLKEEKKKEGEKKETKPKEKMKEEIKEEEKEETKKEKIEEEKEGKKGAEKQIKDELIDSEDKIDKVTKYFAGYIEINLGEKDGIRSGLKVDVFCREEQERTKVAEGYIISVYKEKSVVKLTAQFGIINPKLGDKVEIIK